MSVSAFVRERKKTPKPGPTDDMQVRVHMLGRNKIYPAP